MKRRTSSKHRWEDHYSRKARKENFPARSVYKLKEIHAKFKVFKKGDKVIDLGCAPGSWLLYAAQVVGHKGQVIGIDQKPVKLSPPAQVKIITADIFDTGEPAIEGLGSDFNVVLSDMAPATTGIKDVDAARSFNLAAAAHALAQSALRPGGCLVCKIFQGPDFQDFQNRVKQCYKKVKIYKPQSTRKASKEIYIIAMGKK
jgi:23S rRNA (uridine2552-2'-O)-methyltransferase